MWAKLNKKLSFINPGKQTKNEKLKRNVYKGKFNFIKKKENKTEK